MTQIKCEAIDCLFNNGGKCIKPTVELKTERYRVCGEEVVELRLICTDYQK